MHRVMSDEDAPRPHDPVKRSDDLDRKIGMSVTTEQIPTMIAYLMKAHRRDRRRWIVTWTSIMIDVVLSAALAVLWVISDSQTHDIQSNAVSVKASCVSGNEFRTAERSLWEFILTQPPTTPQTPDRAAARAKQAESFRLYLDKAFALRDCNKIPPR